MKDLLAKIHDLMGDVMIKQDECQDSDNYPETNALHTAYYFLQKASMALQDPAVQQMSMNLDDYTEVEP